MVHHPRRRLRKTRTRITVWRSPIRMPLTEDRKPIPTRNIALPRPRHPTTRTQDTNRRRMTRTRATVPERRTLTPGMT